MSSEIKDKKIFLHAWNEEKASEDGKKWKSAVTNGKSKARRGKKSGQSIKKTSRMRREDTSHNDSYPIGEQQPHLRNVIYESDWEGKRGRLKPSEKDENSRAEPFN